jgi:hypothetical protein
MARYNVRDLIGHYVAPRSAEGKMWPQACCGSVPILLPVSGRQVAAHIKGAELPGLCITLIMLPRRFIPILVAQLFPAPHPCAYHVPIRHELPGCRLPTPPFV